MNVAGAWLAGGDDRPAIIERRGTTSRAQLRDRAARYTGAAVALPEGARIGLALPAGAEFAAAYFGILGAGRVVVPVDPRTEHSALTSLTAQLHLTAWVGDAPPPGIATLDPAEPRDPESVAPETLAALMLTSGSTAAPKAVRISHQNLAVNTREIVAALGLGESDRLLAVLPFHYCYGLTLLHSALAAGGAVVVEPSLTFPEHVLDRVQETECTVIAGVPSTWHVLLKRSRFAQRRFPSLRLFQAAGGRLPEADVRALRASHPEVRLFLMYGQTEATARLTVLDPVKADTKPGSVGRPLPSVELWVERPDGARCDPGEVGAVCARGPSIALGYDRQQQRASTEGSEDENVFVHGTLRTGDIGWLDADGDLILVGRERLFIKTAGIRTSPYEVEDVLCRAPGVDAAVVVGVPDPLLGEALVAIYVGAATATELRAHASAHLTSAKVPRDFHNRPALPTTSTGKVDRAAALRSLS